MKQTDWWRTAVKRHMHRQILSSLIPLIPFKSSRVSLTSCNNSILHQIWRFRHQFWCNFIICLIVFSPNAFYFLVSLCMCRTFWLGFCLSSVPVQTFRRYRQTRFCSWAQIRLMHKGRNFIPLQLSTREKTDVKHVASHSAVTSCLHGSSSVIRRHHCQYFANSCKTQGTISPLLLCFLTCINPLPAFTQVTTRVSFITRLLLCPPSFFYSLKNIQPGCSVTFHCSDGAFKLRMTNYLHRWKPRKWTGCSQNIREKSCVSKDI